jgi:type I restriction enzyme S subunit
MADDRALLSIGELCDRGAAFIQTGPFGSQLHAYEYQPHGTAVIPTEAIGRRRILPIELPRVDDAVVQRLEKHRLSEGDILFARRGAQATGSSALVEKSHQGALCGTGAILLRITDRSLLDPAYLSFALIAPASIQWLKDNAVGAVMPNLNSDVIRRLHLWIPLLPEQRAIAHILGTLDDKIALNRQMNETLESMARAQFKSWFVDFDPVRAKAEGRQPAGMDAETAKLFPTDCVEAGSGQAPRGWRVARFGEVAEQVRDTVSPTEVPPETPYIGLEHMPKRSIALNDWGTAAEAASQKTRFKVDQILFGKLRPYFHKVGVAPVSGVCSTDIVVLQPRVPHAFSFVLGHASSDSFVAHANAGSDGTRMPRTNWDRMSSFLVTVPPEGILKAFNNTCVHAVRKIRANIFENHTLAELRDTLLPRLLSGELSVANTE